MATTVFDDGSTLTTTDAGDVVSVSDAQGNDIPANQSILQQFANIITFGAKSALQKKTAPASAAAPTPAAAPSPFAALMQSPYVFIAMGLGAFLLLHRK